jgi:hypothetical protein
MQLSQIDNLFRVYTSETDPVNGRWTYADVATLANQSRWAINSELDWPQGTVSATTITGQMEYQLPLLTKVLRVYLSGQLLVPTTIPQLNGEQIEFWDQTAANNIPQWLAQTNTVYPVTGTAYGAPYPSTLPFYQGMRPMWYLRGGNIGFVPQPAGAYPITIDIVPRPAALVNQTDVDNMYDQFFLEAIVQGMVMRAMQADRDMDARMAAALAFKQEMGKLQSWVADMRSGAPRGPIPVVYRAFYQNTGNSVQDCY